MRGRKEEQVATDKTGLAPPARPTSLSEGIVTDGGRAASASQHFTPSLLRMCRAAAQQCQWRARPSEVKAAGGWRRPSALEWRNPPSALEMGPATFMNLPEGCWGSQAPPA